MDALGTGHVAEIWLRSDLDGDLPSELRRRADEADILLGEASRADFDQLGRTVSPQGVLALVRDSARPLKDVLGLPGLFLWLDGVQDPGNVGALVRVAAGLGAAGLLVGGGSADPLGLKALRASAGLALRIAFARAAADDIAEALGTSNTPVWLLEQGGADLFEVSRAPATLVLVVGSEGRGISRSARGVAQAALGIPLCAEVDSLNVAVAAGIAVAHLSRSTR